MGRNSRSRDYLRFPPEIQGHADALMQWALDNSNGDMNTTPISAAISLISCNLRETVTTNAEIRPDGRSVQYGARVAAVHPESGDYLAAGPWSYGLQGMEGVWKYVADTAWQLYEGMEALPMELTLGELSERTNTARVAMSRRADGVAVIRVRFEWQKKREKRNLRRGAEAEPAQIVWDKQTAQVNVWIGPTVEARAMDVAERASRHPLAYTE